MKILYDHQIFSSQNFGGISRYFSELMSNFKNDDGLNFDLSLFFSNNEYLEGNQFLNFYNFLIKSNFKGRSKLLNFINKIFTITKLKEQNFDVFHPTYYDPYFLKYLGKKPFVLTIYDMIHEKHKKMFLQNDQTSDNKKLLAEKATKIIAISKNTKNDIMDIFGIKEDKIKVIYLANSLKKKKINTQHDYHIPKKYLLFLGSRGKYKNFELFIKSISEILYRDAKLYLVCIGGGKFSYEEKKFLYTHKMFNRTFQFDVAEKDLYYFYSNSLAFIFPSLYEGFGIPILESFYSGCPVICSNVSSLPEIAGNGANYFDPNSKDSMYNTINNTIYNKKIKDQLIKNGYLQLDKFSWRETSIQTKEIYSSVC